MIESSIKKVQKLKTVLDATRTTKQKIKPITKLQILYLSTY